MTAQLCNAEDGALEVWTANSDDAVNTPPLPLDPDSAITDELKYSQDSATVMSLHGVNNQARQPRLPPTLQTLPTDLHFEILKHLRDYPVSAVCLGLTCKELHAVQCKVVRYCNIRQEETNIRSGISFDLGLHHFIRIWMWNGAGLVWGGKYGLAFITKDHRAKEELKLAKIKELIPRDLYVYNVADKDYELLWVITRRRIAPSISRPNRTPEVRIARRDAYKTNARAFAMMTEEHGLQDDLVFRELFGREVPEAMYVTEVMGEGSDA